MEREQGGGMGEEQECYSKMVMAEQKFKEQNKA